MHRVVMLVNNDWKVDSRVMREAATLAAAGHEVHVISRHGDEARVDRHGAVTVHSIPLESGSAWARMAAMFRSHCRVVAAAAGPGSPRGILARMACLGAKGLLTGLDKVRPPRAPGAPVRAAARVLLQARRAWRGVRRRVAGPIPDRAPPSWLQRMEVSGLGEGQRPARRPVFPEYIRYLNGFAAEGLPLALSLAPTVVHSHDLVTLSTGYAAARRLACPLVYDAHELETHTNYWNLEQRTHDWVAVYESVLVRHARAVVTVCDSIADWLRDHYAIPRPVVVLNSPDLPTQGGAAVARDVRQQLGLAKHQPLAIYVGSVTLDRGMAQCVRATARVEGLHFAFVGPRYQVTEQEILQEAQALGIADRIHLVDPVPSREVSSFVASADCSVIAIQNVCLSYYFCFPNKLLESVTSGIPVAVAQLAELQKFVGRFPVGVTMDEKDPGSIADAIRALLANPARYRAAPAVVEQIRAEYGWPAQESRLRALYDTLPPAPVSTAPLSSAISGQRS